MKIYRNEKNLPSLKFISFIMTGATLLLFIGLIVIVFITNMLNMLGRNEQENIRQQGNIASGIISASNANIQSVTRDWSSWDETYAFALGENEAYIEEVLTDYPFLLHNLNFAVIKDKAGSDLYAEFYDVASEQSIPVPKGFTDYLDAIAKDMLESFSPDRAVNFKASLGKDGFLFYDGVCYYVCAMPVLTSDETSEPAGTFFFGRIIDEAEMGRITGYQKMNYTIIDRSSPEIKGLSQEFSENEAFSFGKDNFVYYRAIPDYFGEDNIVLRVEEPRSLHNDGIRIIALTCTAIGLAVLLMAAVFMYLINRYFLRPLDRLTTDLESITTATSSINTSGYDSYREFNILGASINEMLERLEEDRIHLEHSTVSINVMKNILNGMEALLYVSDPQTDEILFVNDRMKEQFGLGDDVVGSICWKVLQSGFEKRCNFCPNHKLLKYPDAPVIWEEQNTVTGRYYRNVDCIIEWSNGEKAHLQHSTDITDIKTAEAALNKRLKQQELMSAISQSFTSTEDTQKLICEALKTAGEFMNVNQVFLSIYRKDENSLDCLYEWFDKKGKSFIESENRWPITPDMQIFRDLTVNGYAAVADCNLLSHPNFEAVKEHKLGAFLNIPVEVSGEFWGVLGFIIYENPYDWSESDIYLGKMIAGAFSGVISRNLIEESLFSAKQMLSAVLENAPMSIFWKDKDLVYRGANVYYENFMGKTGDEIVGHDDTELFRPEVASQIVKFDSDFLESGKDIDIDDVQIANGKGELRWVHVNRSLIRDSKNQPSLIVGVFEDITERKKTEEELLRMSAIVNASPQYISYVNAEGRFDFFNPAAYRLTGYTHDELMDGGMQILYDEPTNQKIRDEIMPAIFSHGEYAFELSLVRKDGEIRVMSFSAFTIESDEYGMGSIASDVTEQKRLESELIKAKEAAEQASRAKGEFLSRMSHEMRTPMNAIIGMTSIAQSSDDPAKKDYCLKKIDAASKHLLGVINDVLDMSKIEANKFDLSPTEFSFEKMLQKVVNIINFRIDEKQQNFTVHIDRDIPRTLIGDDQRLAQVITNLLTNSVKFTPERGSVRLDTHLVKEENGVCTLQIEVTDTGIGISEEQQFRLFTSFEQAENSTSRKFGGTGLGLAISKRIVEMMGGRIWIESELGKGSTFAFTIQAGCGEEKHHSLLNPGVNWKNIRILAVDDMPEIREYFADITGRFGIVCDTAASGEEAIGLIQQCGYYDMYFVDWKMPEMDGIELSRRIKEGSPGNSVIIMISATEWNVIETDAKSAGVDRFLSKPLFPSAIADCINECLGMNAIHSAEDALVEEMDNFEGYCVLLAEDVEINREIVLALLEPTSLMIDCAENGAEAVKLYSDAPGRYDMIFMDVQMPEMDGYDATRNIRALDAPEAKSVPIIAMTANVFREDVEKCLAAGMNDHVGKPLDLDELLDKMRKYLPQ